MTKRKWTAKQLEQMRDAAPDLYEALEGVVDWFDVNEIDDPRIFEARAALAKARGESE